MPRRRTNPLPSECVRLRPRHLLQAFGAEPAAAPAPGVIWLDGREGPRSYPLVAALAGHDGPDTLAFALAVVPPPFSLGTQPASQVLTVRQEADGRGRRRYFFLCRDPEGRHRAEVLYLAPGADRFRCRQCCRVLYRLFPPEPWGGYQPWWDTLPGHLGGECQQVVQAARHLLAQFPPTPPVPERSPRGVTRARRHGLQRRQKAVAHLWGQCGWAPEELAELFSVSVRSIKRDLSRARASGEAPQHRTARLAPPIVAHARRLLAESSLLRQWARETAECDPRSESGLLWAEAICARLLRDEARLVRVLAQLGDTQPVALPSTGPRRQAVGLTDQGLVMLARATLEEAIRSCQNRAATRAQAAAREGGADPGVAPGCGGEAPPPGTSRRGEERT